MRPVKPLLNESLTRPDWIGAVPRDSKFIWLDKNENLDPTYLDWINNELVPQVNQLDMSTYPELGQLYDDLAALDQIDPHCLLLTTGSDGAIRTVFQSFVEQGDTVFITNPSFAMYDVYCKLYGANTVYIDYTRADDKVSIDVTMMSDRIRREQPKLVCLPNPDSPTGTVFSPNEIITIYNACVSVDAILFVDEAYFPFYDQSVIEYIKARKENLVLCRTFSKAWGLAGVRVGYLVSNSAVISLMNKTRPMYEVGSLSLKIAHAIVTHEDKMYRSVKTIIEGKKFFENEMKKIGFPILKTFGNFSHVRFDERKEKIFKKLDQFVYYRKDFLHPSLNGYTRFSVAPVDIMSKVTDVISSIK